MTSKFDIVKPKTVHVYELDEFEKLLKGLRVASCMLTECQPIGKITKVFIKIVKKLRKY